MEEENKRILEFSNLQQQREEERMKKQKAEEEATAEAQAKVGPHCYYHVIMCLPAGC